MISPSITLFYKGEYSHKSIFSALLTVIAYMISIAFGIYYIVSYVKLRDPSAYYFNRYIENAGEFPVNSSSMFNFLQLYYTEINYPGKIDFDAVRFIGLEETIDHYKDNNNLSDYNHWIYGNCNNDTDTKGVGYLIDMDYFTESACIRLYYNKDDKKYYKTNENKFRWPDILYGCSHPNRTFYGIIMEKCRNDSLKELSDGRKCKSDEEIIDFIKHRSLAFQIIDHYADVLNYKQPFTKYFYEISNGLFEESYTVNHLNFNPALMETHHGIFMDKTEQVLSYFFDQNEKVTASSGNSGIYVAFYFWMQNRLQYYGRRYKRFQEVLSDIGGLSSTVISASIVINYLVSYYIILIDAEDMIFNFEKNKSQRKPNLIIKKGNVGRSSKLQNKRSKDHVKFDLNSNLSKESGIEICTNISKDKGKSDQSQIDNINPISQLEDLKKNNISNEQNSNLNNSNKIKSNQQLKGYIENNLQTKSNFTWINFVHYIICCKTTNRKIRYYDFIRKRIISEENFIRTFLDVFGLKKIGKNLYDDRKII